MIDKYLQMINYKVVFNPLIILTALIKRCGLSEDISLNSESVAFNKLEMSVRLLDGGNPKSSNTLEKYSENEGKI